MNKKSYISDNVKNVISAFMFQIGNGDNKPKRKILIILMTIILVILCCLIFFSFNAYVSTININNQIKNIGEVTINSEDTISSLEQEYNGLNTFQRLFVYKYNDLAKARKIFNTLPIPLTIDNIGKYISYDVKFKDYFETMDFFWHNASANAEVTTIPLKDVYFDNVVIRVKVGVVQGSWKGDGITLKLSSDGSAHSSGHMRYSEYRVYYHPSMPQYSGMEIINVSGNIYNDKQNH